MGVYYAFIGCLHIYVDRDVKRGHVSHVFERSATPFDALPIDDANFIDRWTWN